MNDKIRPRLDGDIHVLETLKRGNTITSIKLVLVELEILGFEYPDAIQHDYDVDLFQLSIDGSVYCYDDCYCLPLDIDTLGYRRFKALCIEFDIFTIKAFDKYEKGEDNQYER